MCRPARPGPLLFSLLLWSSLLLATAEESIAQGPSPFVAGFDRFVRSRDIDQQTGGRLLLGELSCTACHASAIKRLAPKKGPSLEAAGHRLQRRWLARFLEKPHTVKPGTTMPDLLRGLAPKKKHLVIEALVAFLMEQRGPFPALVSTATKPIAPQFWRKGDSSRGRRIYHRVGCVACHEPDSDYPVIAQPPSTLEKLLSQLSPEELRELGLEAAARPVRSIPHGALAEKYTPKSLSFFLLRPETVRPAGRMPDMKLDTAEAADLAAYLLRKQDSAPPPADTPGVASLVAEGRRLFSVLGCAHCHAAAKTRSTLTAKSLARLNLDAAVSCLLPSSLSLPDYQLDKPQREAIRQALSHLATSQSEKQTEANQVQWHLLQSNCLACHVRSRQGGIGPKRRRYFETAAHVDLGDEGRLPPPLDGVGAKLTGGWLKKVFEGSGDVRPHMHARMPKFPTSSVAALPGWLAVADEHRPRTASAVFGKTTGLAGPGRTLTDTGCVQCHPVRGERLPGVIGIDLAGTADRIHPDWMKRFLFDPASLKRGTRMPTFFPKGKTNSPRVLAGNVDRQLAALWTYLKEIPRQPLPEKIVRGKVDNYELTPTDRPILLRTFMRDAGRHAIAVGFPRKVHLAFDARQVRMVQAWRGRFLDAHATWFNRFIPDAQPLGDHVISLPAGLSLARLPHPRTPWPTSDSETAGYRFSGYRLDRSGIPTFLYRFGSLSIEDRITPTKEGGLRRQLKATNTSDSGDPEPPLWFRAQLGKTLRASGTQGQVNDAGLHVQLVAPRKTSGVIRNIKKQTEWIIPLDARNGRVVWEVIYRW